MKSTVAPAPNVVASQVPAIEVASLGRKALTRARDHRLVGGVEREDEVGRDAR